MIPFWSNDPTVLFNKSYITELWPSPEMSYEQKLNSISRCIILLTIIGYLSTSKFSFLVAGFLSLVVIWFMYKQRKVKITKEGFNMINSGTTLKEDAPVQLDGSKELQKVVNEEFDEGTKRNPFGNVLLTDIMDNPEKKSAPPSFNPDIEEKITKNVKRSVQMMNSSIDNTNKQLYGDLWENFELDQSNRRFYSTANTKVVNDQGAFAEFLYGNMPSGKSSGPDGDFARVQDNYRYTLY
jgi:hypothetical protein